MLASFGGDQSLAVWAIGGGILFAVLVLTLGRRLLKRLEPFAARGDGARGPLLSVVVLLLCLAAWFTDFIGIYAVFGAFVLGVAMPRGVLTKDLERTLAPVTANFLLPLFFVYSGLNTRLGLVTTPTLVGITVVLILIACLAKGAACYLAARLNGESNEESLAIGALMNARGLMELIILGIGLEREIITPTLFTMMVIMAIVTTLIASPAFEWVYGRKHKGTATSTSVPPLAA